MRSCNMMQVVIRLVLLIAVAGTATQLLAVTAAQAPGFGRVKGRVMDQNGADIAAARLTIQNKGRTIDKGYTEDANYQFELPPGVFRVTVQSDGFRPVLKRVRVRAGTTTTMNFRLKRCRRC